MRSRRQAFLHGEPALVREHPSFTVNDMMFGGAVARPPVQNSLRFRAANSAYLSRTPGVAATDSTKWTVSLWVKRGFIGSDSVYYTLINAEPGAWTTLAFYNDQIHFQVNDGGAARLLQTTRVFRDPGAWYHIVAVWDRANGTAAQKMRLYINGTEETVFTTDNRASISGSANPGWNVSGTANVISKYPGGASRYFDGIIARIENIDGQVLTPSSFGQTDAATNMWVPKVYAGSYGTNGFRLKFDDTTSTTTLGNDTSGNGNNWTLTNFSTTAGATYDPSVDVPTNSYARFNPLGIMGGATTGPATLSEANTKAVGGALTGRTHIADFAIPPNSGVWFWEAVCISGTAYFVTGILRNGTTTGNDLGSTANGYTYRGDTGNKRTNSTNSAYGATFTTNDVIGCKFDSNAGTLEFFKNGTSQGTAFTGIASDFYYPAFGHDSMTLVFNSGWRAFAYPSNQGTAKTLCTGNLSTPSIKLPSAQFNVVTYTGTGASLNVTGVGFQPDLVWIKGRSSATDHALYDAVRGVQNQLESNNTGAETTETTGLTAFGSDGFTVGALAQVNTNTASYVAWNWKEGATPGFDIVTYTGNGANRTISHALGAVPHLIIVKGRSGTIGGNQNWRVYHRNANASPQSGGLYLSLTNGFTTDSTWWNNTTPTSSVFSVGTDAGVNSSDGTYVAYLWTEIPGFSRIGSYVGNSSSDGTFVECGFRPAFILIKSTAGGSQWMIYDDKRDGYNVDNDHLNPDDNATEGTDDDIDFLSNGFKLRRSSPNFNDGSTFIFAAFARAPFKYANAR